VTPPANIPSKPTWHENNDVNIEKNEEISSVENDTPTTKKMPTPKTKASTLES
jgi:hypothetical protein